MSFGSTFGHHFDARQDHLEALPSPLGSPAMEAEECYEDTRTPSRVPPRAPPDEKTIKKQYTIVQKKLTGRRLIILELINTYRYRSPGGRELISQR